MTNQSRPKTSLHRSMVRSMLPWLSLMPRSAHLLVKSEVGTPLINANVNSQLNAKAKTLLIKASTPLFEVNTLLVKAMTNPHSKGQCQSQQSDAQHLSHPSISQDKCWQSTGKDQDQHNWSRKRSTLHLVKAKVHILPAMIKTQLAKPRVKTELVKVQALKLQW